MNEGSIEDVIANIEELTWEFNGSGFRQYLFEYACVVCEWGGINPRKATGFMAKTMLEKARDYYAKIEFILAVKPNSKIHATEFNFDTETITQEVRADYGGGVPAKDYNGPKNGQK